MKTIKLLRDLVLIGPLPEPKTTKTGIALISNDNEAGVRRGMVLSIGPGLFDKNGKRIKMPCKPGDTVMFAKSGLQQVVVAGEKLVVVPSSEIICILDVNR